MPTHRVNKGETLAKIAMYFYGDPTQWKTIYAANDKIIKNPNQIQVGQVLSIPSSCDRQRSMMTNEEQLRCPEKGVTYPIEFEVLELLVGATALLKGLFKAGVKVLSKKATHASADDVFKAVINPKTGRKEYPHSPYLDKSRHPKEVMEEINTKIAQEIKNVDPHKIGRQNAEIQRIHDEFIKTGKWPLKNPQMGEYHSSLPDAGLIQARKAYLDALNLHR
ncbi:MAG: LysM peptidoglycan-binding domain-containing protein [Pirellulales bacterium]|nr:LysM peptidoglycan-binding domain-containing protein [Pirellulales bacterium]